MVSIQKTSGETGHGSNELLRLGPSGLQEEGRLEGFRTELWTSLEQIEALTVGSCEGLQKVVLDAPREHHAVAGCASVPWGSGSF